jgi:hypothetical protein
MYIAKAVAGAIVLASAVVSSGIADSAAGQRAWHSTEAMNC